jgi:hypothetical protein
MLADISLGLIINVTNFFCENVPLIVWTSANMCDVMPSQTAPVYNIYSDMVLQFSAVAHTFKQRPCVVFDSWIGFREHYMAEKSRVNTGLTLEFLLQE